MARFIRGDVIVGVFPFSNGTGVKRRPALVVGAWDFTDAYQTGTDYLLCVISSQNVSDGYTFALQSDDLLNGSLKVQSYIRPTYLFAADEQAISRKIGTLKPETLDRVLQVLQLFFQ